MQFEQGLDALHGPSTFVDMLRYRAALQRDERAFTFLVDGEHEQVHLTYGELDCRALRVAAALTESGLVGQRVLLLYPAGLEFISALFGCFYAGVVAVPLPWPLRQRTIGRLEAITRNATAMGGLTTGSALDQIAPSLERLIPGVGWVASDRLAADLGQGYEPQSPDGESIALLQYTSGSAGSPKGVMLSHLNLMHNSASICHCFEHTRSMRGVFWLPSFHDMGLVCGILQPIFVGRPNILMAPMAVLQKPLRWLQAISRYGATTSGGPNFVYDLCVQKITPEQCDGLDLSSWDVAFNGAEPVRPRTLDRFAEAFAPYGFKRQAFYPSYGLAEATLLVCGGQKSDPPVVRSFDCQALHGHRVVPAEPDSPGSRALVGCGQTTPGQHMVIVDPSTCTPLGADQVGEIWVSGASIAKGYWQQPAESKHTLEATLTEHDSGPFLRTGDLGFVHQGQVFITGRLRDLIIIRGRNHYPQDLELTVQDAHPWLRPDCGAAFTFESSGTEQLAIVHEVKHRRQRDFNEVINAIRHDVLDQHEVNVDVVVLLKPGSIPRTSSGKVQRPLCRQALVEDALLALADWRHSDAPSDDAGGAALTDVGRGQIESIVIAQAVRLAPHMAPKVSMSASLSDLGLDSVQRFELLMAVEKALGGRFPQHTLAELTTLDSVVTTAAADLVRTDQQQPAHNGQVPPAAYRFELFPEYLQLKRTLRDLDDRGLADPYLQVHEPGSGATTVIDGRRLVNFASYDYLGMAVDPVVTDAAKAAIERYGTSVSASRLVSGERSVHRQLEAAIARFVGAEDALVFVGGHATNETTLGHLFGPGDLILHDALAHNSIVQGSLLSGADRRPFAHNDWQALDQLLTDLRPTYRRVVIVVEGVYSMDGDYPDLVRLIEIKQRHKVLLMVDEAHSLGVLGATGRGLAEHLGAAAQQIDIGMGTLSKALGSCGGYIAGSRALVEYLKYTAPGFVYSVGMPPPAAAAALAALELLQRQPERVARLTQRADLFRTLAKEHGLDVGNGRDSAVVPVILGNSERCLRVAQGLFDLGINVQPIVHPAVAEQAARLRFFITSNHREAQIRTAVQATADAAAVLEKGPIHISEQHPSRQASVEV